jgi:anti-sigma B factor antagonist
VIDQKPSAGLRCDIEPDRERVIVRPVGEIDLATVGAVEAPLSELWASGFTRIVLDLRWVSFMDSAGLRLVIRFGRRAQEEGVDLRVIVVEGEAVHRLLEITAMLGVLPVELFPGRHAST